MISFMKSWCEGIIIAVILSIIIELLVPEGSNKKYVKVVVGIYMLFVILNPVLEKINNGIDISEFNRFEYVETSTEINDDIKKVYVEGIKETIKEDLESKGYSVVNLNVDVDKNYENIQKIEIELKKDFLEIEPINIGEKNEKNEEQKYDELKKELSEKYLIEISNIVVR